MAKQRRSLSRRSLYGWQRCLDPVQNLAQDALLRYIMSSQFEGAHSSYRQRSELFRVDHGMALVKTEKDFIEVACF